MRTLKYKLWDTYNKIWLDVSKFNIRLDNWAIQNNKRDWIINWVEIVEFTWLKDKNWKEIYEWDIMEFDSIDKKTKYNKTIEYDKNYWWYSPWAWNDEPWDMPSYDNWIIIWNIYESPELLNN